MKIKGSHVLVTGGARRVGRAIVDNLLESGATVTVHHHRSEVSDLVKKWGSQVRAVQGDLIDRTQWEAIARATGPVDGFIHSASQYAPTPVDQVSPEDWDRFHRIHGECAFFLAQALEIRDGGVVVFIADVNGERPLVGYTPYAVSKAEVLFLTRQLAKEWGPRVRVNSVSPGAVLLPPDYTAAQKQRSLDRSLLKRVGSPEDVVHGVRLLLTNDYMTGFNLRVDGGRSLADY